MEYSCLKLGFKEAVATVTMARPEVHNAFDETMIAELTHCYQTLSNDTAVRVVVLRGEGKSFCAGADLNWMQRMAKFTWEENVADARNLQQMFAAIQQCPKATVAVVQGAAIGGGVGLVSVCDIAIATEEARFSLSEVKIGLVPAVIAPYVLEKVGMGVVRALFVSGQRFDAAEALRIGLVQQVAQTSLLEETVNSQIDLLLQAGPEAVAAVKKLLQEIAMHTPEEAATATITCIASLRISPEGQEGLQAFLQKRPPSWIASNRKEKLPN